MICSKKIIVGSCKNTGRIQQFLYVLRFNEFYCFFSLAMATAKKLIYIKLNSKVLTWLVVDNIREVFVCNGDAII